MALREKLARGMQPYLEPGERIHVTFQAQSRINPTWMMLAALFPVALIVLLLNARMHVVAVTDRGIIIARSSLFRAARPKEFVARLPRAVRLGPLSALWAGPVYLTPDGKKSWIHKRFHKDVHAADGALQHLGPVPVVHAAQPPGQGMPPGPPPR